MKFEIDVNLLKRTLNILFAKKMSDFDTIAEVVEIQDVVLNLRNLPQIKEPKEETKDDSGNTSKAS